MIIDRIEDVDFYAALHPLFPTAFALLRDPATFALPDGRHQLDGDRIIALISSYPSKSRAVLSWEAHRRHIDIQTVISELAADGDYREETDFEPYSGSGMFLTFRPGLFAIFFPGDGHAPGLAIDESAPVRKLVMKIRI